MYPYCRHIRSCLRVRVSSGATGIASSWKYSTIIDAFEAVRKAARPTLVKRFLSYDPSLVRNVAIIAHVDHGNVIDLIITIPV